MKLSTSIIFSLAASAFSAEALRGTRKLQPGAQAASNTGSVTNPPPSQYNYGFNMTKDGIVKKFGEAGSATFMDVTKVTNLTMSLAVIDLAPGAVRELHWHPSSTEWGFVTSGTCRITLMDNEGHYDNIETSVGDIWNFPESWGHSIQGVDEKVGCKMILFFNTPELPTYDGLGLSEILSGFPANVVSENTNTPEDVVKGFYQGTITMNTGPMPPPDFPQSKNPLSEWPVINILQGTCKSYGTGGNMYEVKDDVFPAATTMSGGLISLKAGTLRDIHWHPDSSELHYVLKGKLQVSVLGIGGANQTFILDAGSVGFVPRGFAHYFEAVGEDTEVLLAFDSPSWQTQELSTWLAVTPPYLIAATLNVTVDAVKDFPTTTEYFIGDSADGCPSNPTLPECYGC